jgi:hypothetical protein
MAKKKKSKTGQKAAQQPQPSPKPPATYLEKILGDKYYFLYYAVFIFILTIVLFNEFVFSSKMLFSSDGINASLYFRQFFKDHMHAFGQIPMWTEYIFGGMPYVDAFHSDIFYPLTYVFKMIMPIPRAFGWAMIFHVFLAGLTMYLCARAFGLSKLASSFAGIFFMFAPYLVSMVQPGHDGKMYVTTLFPLTMLFLERGMNKGKFLDFALLGAAVGLIILTPHPQMSYFSLWAIGFYFGFRVIIKLVRKEKILNVIKPSAFFVIAIALGLLISAIQFYPSYKYVKEFSPRSEDEVMTPEKERERYMYATSWSMNAEELKAQFIPNFCGNNATKMVNDQKTHPSTYWGKNAFKDNSEYIGVLPIFLGLIAVIFVRNKRTWFFLGLAAFALIYALGASTPFFKIFYYLIPNVKHLRAPSMIMFIFSFSFCLLAGFGVDYIRGKLQTAKEKQKKAVLLYSAIAAGLYGLGALLFTVGGKGMMSIFKSFFNPSMPEQFLEAYAYPNVPDITIGLWILAAALGLSHFLIKSYSMKKVGLWAVAIILFFGVADDWRMDSKFITTANPDTFLAEKKTVQMIKSQGQIPVDRVLDCDRIILQSSNYFAYYGIPQMFGYHGNQMKIFDQYWGREGKSNDHSSIYSIYFNRRDRNDPMNGQMTWLNIPLMTMAGVKWVICDYGTRLGQYEQSLQQISTYDDIKQDGLILYENPESFGRCRLYHDYLIAPDHDSTLSIIHRQELQYDWKSRVLLEADPGIDRQPEADTTGEIAEIVSYEPNKIMIDAELNEDGILYLADCYYPAWQAYVDGEKAEILLANAAFRAVPLMAGKHTVEFRYESKTFQTASLITYFSSLFVILVIVYNLIIQRKKRTGAVE